MLSETFAAQKEKWIVGGLIVLIILTALNVIVARVKLKKPPVATSKISKTAVLSLEAREDKVTAGKNFSVGIILDPQGARVDAVDVVLSYDPSKLEALQVTPGGIFSTYPVQSVGEGVVKLSGFTLPDKSGQVVAVTKKGVMGTVAFRAKTAGTAEINFKRDQVVVASEGKDVLKEVVPLLVKVR